MQSQKKVGALNFVILEVEELYYLCNENKGADQLRGYAKLVCVFVFAYAKNRFSHHEAHMGGGNIKNYVLITLIIIVE